MTVEYVLSLMLALAPRRSQERLQPIAEAIAATADTVEDAALLVTVSLYETNFGRAGVPFGVSCCWRRGMSLAEAAHIALGVLHTSRERCGASYARMFARFIKNRCEPELQARQRAQMVRRLLLRYPVPAREPAE